jgi:CBS domain-containing protein
MYVKDVMSSPVLTCRTSDTAADCARLMRDANRGFLPVVDAGGRLTGVVTDRDLVTRALAVGLRDAPVGTLATKDVVACRPDDELRMAEEALAHRKTSRIVVAEAGRPVGVLSLADLAQVEDPARFVALYGEVTQREAPRVLASGARSAGPVTWLV